MRKSSVLARSNVAALAAFQVAYLYPPPARAEQPPHCDGSFAAIGENIPFNTTDDGHSIARIASVRAGTALLGWLYVDKNSEKWMSVNYASSASDAVLTSFVRTFSTAVPTSDFPLRGSGMRVDRPITSTMSLDAGRFANRPSTSHGPHAM